MAFIVETKTQGFISEVIKNKLGLRIVQNCNLTFKDMFIPDENRLPKANDFSATNKILAHSRAIIIPFLTYGVS